MKKLLVALVMGFGLTGCALESLESIVEEEVVKLEKNEAVRGVVKNVVQKVSEQTQEASNGGSSPAYVSSDFHEDDPFFDDPGFDEPTTDDTDNGFTDEELDALCADADDPEECKALFGGSGALTFELDETVELEDGGTLKLVGKFSFASDATGTSFLMQIDVEYTDMVVEVEGVSYKVSGSESFTGEMKISTPSLDDPNSSEMPSMTAKFKSVGSVTIEGETSSYEITVEMADDGSVTISGTIDGESFSETLSADEWNDVDDADSGEDNLGDDDVDVEF